ncbi:MAG: DNA-binding protein [Rhodocyclaceae bacterium]|nr:DNA-binding protein [Rhodocyclaceae bacterium]
MHEHFNCDVLVSPEEALQRFRESGVSVAAWAVRNGFNPAIVYAVLRGGRKCLRGQSHQIAVSLGIKLGRRGSVVSPPRNVPGTAKTLSNEFQGGNGSENSRVSVNGEVTSEEEDVAAN